MKHIFIVNTKSDKGRLLDKIFAIEDICKSLDVEYEVYPTYSKEEAQHIANFYKSKDCVIYAIGGDGTINTILNSIVGGNAFLGIVPQGSGNDTYKTLSEHKDLITECNVMKVNDKYCLNIFSAGFDAEVCQAVEELKNLNIPRSQLYNLGIAYTFFKHQNKPILIKDDDEFIYHDQFTMITVCNGKYYGGGIKIAPDADICSREAQIYLVHNLKRRNMPGFLASVLRGTHEDSKFVDRLNTKDFEIFSNSPVLANVDGEVFSDEYFQVDTSAATIKVVQNSKLMRKLDKKS